MLRNILLHPKNLSELELFKASGSHGLLLCGGVGAGTESVARELAAELLGIKIEKLAEHAYFQEVAPEGTAIPIESIRNLQQFLKLKVPSGKVINRVIYIQQADRMKQEAQNALLKTLEEPPAGTVVLLSAPRPKALLPTVRSRLQVVELLPIDSAQARAFVSRMGIRSVDVDIAYALSQGESELFLALVQNTDHALHHSIALAKDVIARAPAQRLLLTDELSKDKTAARQLLDALRRIAHAALVSASTRNDITAITRWHQMERAVLTADGHLRKNGNLKLVIDELFLAI